MAKEDYKLIRSYNNIVLAMKVAVESQGKYIWEMVDIFYTHEEDKAQLALQRIQAKE
jgi:Zn-finger protein